MTLSTSVVAVCCRRDLSSSTVRCRNSLSSRAFSMAMTACCAKFSRSATSFGERPYLPAGGDDLTEQDLVLAQRDEQDCPHPGDLCRRLRDRVVHAPDVDDVNKALPIYQSP